MASYWVEVKVLARCVCVFVDHRVLVPDECGLVTQSAGGAAGQCHSLSLCDYSWSHYHLQSW